MSFCLAVFRLLGCDFFGIGFKPSRRWTAGDPATTTHLHGLSSRPTHTSNPVPARAPGSSWARPEPFLFADSSQLVKCDRSSSVTEEGAGASRLPVSSDRGCRD